MPVKFCVEAWTIPGGEEPCEEEMVESQEFDLLSDATAWCLDRMEEGYQTRLYRR